MKEEKIINPMEVGVIVDIFHFLATPNLNRHLSYLRDFLFEWVWFRQGPPPSVEIQQGRILHFPVNLATRAQACYLISISRLLPPGTCITSWRSDPKMQGQRLFLVAAAEAGAFNGGILTSWFLDCWSILSVWPGCASSPPSPTQPPSSPFF